MNGFVTPLTYSFFCFFIGVWLNQVEFEVKVEKRPLIIIANLLLILLSVVVGCELHLEVRIGEVAIALCFEFGLSLLVFNGFCAISVGFVDFLLNEEFLLLNMPEFFSVLEHYGHWARSTNAHCIYNFCLVSNLNELLGNLT